MSSESLEIYLNSKTANQYLDDNVADCIFNIPNIEIDILKEDVYVGVRNAVVPYSWYVVNSTNNKLDLTINGSSYSISIPLGNYNVNTLATQIKTELDILQTPHGHDGDLTITYLAKLNKYYFFHSHHQFSFLSTSTCFELLGFKDGNTYIASALPFQTLKHELTSTIGINLFVVRAIYVNSNNFILQNINSSTPSNASILASISTTGNPNSIIHYENTTSKHKIHHLNNISNLHIKLTDQDGDILELNNINWSMVLEITIIPK
jgi:hypothetical protein